MSVVGDVLELLYGARDRWTTLQCTVHHWQHAERSRRATERWAARSRAVMHAYAGDPGEQPETYEHSERLWIAKPDRFRIETDHHTQVIRGGTWWSWSEHDGFMSNEHGPEIQSGNPLQSYAAQLDPATVIPQLAIEQIDGLVVQGRPRSDDLFGPGLPHGADLYRLTLDQRGVVLSLESFVDGEPFNRSALTDVVWDEEIADGVFRLEIPAGEEVVNPQDRHLPMLTVEEAANAASFAVFAIAELPDGMWRTQAHLHRHRKQPEHLTILYHRADGRGSINLQERPSRERFAWSRMHDSAEVTVELGGTTISLQSQDYDEETLRRLADGLVRV